MTKQISSILLPIYTIILFSGCTAGLTEPEIDFKPPKYVEEMPSREGKKDYASTGSIFGQGENPLFSDHKAMNVNDIVKVVISETAKSSNNGSKQLSESDALTLGGGLLLNDFSSGSTVGAGATARQSDTLGRLNTGFLASSSSGYKGQGAATKDASFNTIVSARVVKVLENGNYFISGKREILVDEQKQIIQISGVIRPYDIDQTNTISSSQMSDAKILYKTEGDVDRATQRGWGSKLIDAVWPF